MAKTLSHRDGHCNIPSRRPISSVVAYVLLHTAGHHCHLAIMLAIYNHDCWHHHNHDITQNLAEKVFYCDGGHDNSDGAIAIIGVVSILMAAAAAP